MDRSHPRVPVSARCGAGGSARDLGSRGRRFETCHRDQIVRALGCGRSSMEEPWAVNPLVPVRLRPVTPKRMPFNASRTRVAENRVLTPDGQGSSPWRRTTHHPPRGGIGRRTGLRNRSRRACPFDSDRGDHFQQSGSSAAEQRPHKAKAGGSCPPRTTMFSQDHQPPRRCDMKPITEDDVCFRGHEQATQGIPV